MSYLVLARKHRPQKFDEVVAQRHITVTLENAIRQKRFSHAYLFTGTRGTGKTTTARILAKALNCEKGPAPVPCNECDNCRQITAGSSMDVMEIDAASNTGVDDIRALRESAYYSPTASSYKIYIIDEIHRLSGNAFDALLKILEEPPAHVIFVFATTDPQRLPATILSRCQRYDFRRIPYGEMTEYLGHLAELEKIDIDREALGMIAQKGDGSLRDALSIFEQVMACSEGKITREAIADTLGLVELTLLFDLTACILQKDAAGALGIVEEMLNSGVDISQFILDFQEHFRKILIINSTDEPFDYLAVSDFYQDKYLALKNKFTDSDIFRIIKMLADLAADLKAGADPAIFLEVGILRLVKMESSVMLEDVLKKLSGMPSSGGKADSGLFGSSNSGPSQAKSPASNEALSRPSQSKPPQSNNKSNTNPGPQASGQSENRAKMVSPVSWNDFLEDVKSEKRYLAELLMQGELTRMDDNSVELTIAGNGLALKGMIAKLDNQRVIEKSMQKVFGKALRLITKVDKSRASESETSNPNSRFDVSVEDFYKQNPDMKKVTDSIGGEIRTIKMMKNKGEDNG